jgi:hypothetical protein
VWLLVSNVVYGADMTPIVSPLGGADGTAVAGRFQVTFDLPDGTVPEPGTLASAGLALAAALGSRRRSRSGALSRSCAGPR